MRLPIFQVDAFCETVFTGNPAAVVPLETWLPDDNLLAIAEENNLSETAFVVGAGGNWELRWFTPITEVALCGHATLGAAHAIFEHLAQDEQVLRFSTRQSGVLTVKKSETGLSMSFPTLAPSQIENLPAVESALGAQPVSLWLASYSAKERDLLAVFDTEEEIVKLSPDFAAIKDIDTRGIICTAAGESTDFVSRYFAPTIGVPEDPFCGSSHCILTPYWADRLGKLDLTSCQTSQRKGWATCRLRQDRVELSGKAVTFMVGEIEI